ncbi:MAG: glycosyltransferase [Desulfocapsaceae bacterium]|nr:glycosyltransferase [Desulfocapsaceae bacterium]
MLTIVVPCYNEANRLAPEVFVDFIRQNPGIDFLFVNDGSTDTTKEVIAAMTRQAESRIGLLHIPVNGGKAEAVRRGILQALANPAPEYVGYWDADLATPLAAIHDLLAAAQAAPARQFICGARVRRMGAFIRRQWLRHYFGRLIATAASTILELPFYDTQCGAKLIDRDLAARIFMQPFISPWLFDLELIARIIGNLGRRQAYEAIYEVPLAAWTDVGESKVRLSYLPRIPYELLRIRRTYRVFLRIP